MESNLWRRLIVILTALLLTTLWACGGAGESDLEAVVAREAAKMENRAPELEITAQALAGAYAADKAMADESYNNRVVLLTGIVRYVGEDVAEHPYIILGDENEKVQVLLARRYHKVYHMKFKKRFDKYYQQVVKMQPGEKVSFKGVCAGKYDSVMVRGAVITPDGGSL